MSPLAHQLSTLPKPNERPVAPGTSSDHDTDAQHLEATHESVAVRFIQPHGAALDDPLRRLARALGRDAARRHMARGNSIVEVSFVLVLAALALAIRAWSQQ